MTDKVTWGDIYKDFRSRHPRLKNEVLDYRPYNFLTIIIWLKDKSVITYDYSTKGCLFIKEDVV